MKANTILLALGACLFVGACASAGSAPRDEETTPRPTIIRDDSQIVIDTGGIPPDKEAEIKLLLQQHESSATRCYQDVLNEKHTREFKGSVKVLISINTGGQATGVRVLGGTLGDQEVQHCLMGALKDLDYPRLDRGGDVQYEYNFQPQY